MDFCLPIRPFQKKFFKDYFFTELVDFGVPFSINFLSSSEFSVFRKGLEEDAIAFSISVIRRRENF